MQSRHDEFRELGVELVAISSADTEAHAELARKIGATFPILSDPGGAVSSAYGVLHAGGNPFGGGDIARPGVFVIDRDRRIRHAFVTENWRVRERPEGLLDAIRSLEPESR